MRSLRPCGTRAAYRRHRTANEQACEPCLAAMREHELKHRKTKAPTQRTNVTTAELIHEIEFLLKAGEGTHRIITALNYLGREETLKSRLRRAGRTDLTNRILRMDEHVAA